MFGKVAADVLGLSDIGSVIKPENYDKVDADDYVMHEDGEKIYFLIKSKSDEYCFTNKALIHLDGTSATSKKRVLRRYDYYKHPISDVSLETAGTVDLDVEMKFKIGAHVYSIDVHKKYLEELKDLYKSLLAIAELCHENETKLEYAHKSLELTANVFGRVKSDTNNFLADFKAVNELAFQWLVDAKTKYTVKDFSFVFERYINH
jgi:Bacterial PH domain/YvbH-like oligomerisation region